MASGGRLEKEEAEKTLEWLDGKVSKRRDLTEKYGGDEMDYRKSRSLLIDPDELDVGMYVRIRTWEDMVQVFGTCKKGYNLNVPFSMSLKLYNEIKNNDRIVRIDQKSVNMWIAYIPDCKKHTFFLVPETVEEVLDEDEQLEKAEYVIFSNNKGNPIMPVAYIDGDTVYNDIGDVIVENVDGNIEYAVKKYSEILFNKYKMPDEPDDYKISVFKMTDRKDFNLKRNIQTTVERLNSDENE